MGIDPIPNANNLFILLAMGHGDEIVIADGGPPPRQQQSD
jgi:L-fucose mutarotase/ribose pyranase (RbsD/FucU family)